jgi:glycerophosphoryl diester phosphodiesterase
MRRIRATVVVALLVAGGLLATPVAQATHPSVDEKSKPCRKTLVSAHEGYTKSHDADTVESQRAAFHVGSNVADSDLWVTKDGYLVEIHDNDVSKTTDGTGLVTQMTLEEIQKLRTRPYHEKVPQLSDSLAIKKAHKSGRYLMLETKWIFNNKANLQKLVDEISAAGMTDHVIIYASFLKQMQTLQQMDPDLTVWYKLISSPDKAAPDLSALEGVDGLMVSPLRLTPELVDELHAKGMQVIRERTSVENPLKWKLFLESGADGLMTIDPPYVVAECRKLP